VPPPLLKEYVDYEDVEYAAPAMQRWLRALLALMALCLVTVFSVAIWLNPYREDGQARQLETHRQLGLPECNFKLWTGKPCPSCGMTTSFALLIRGDVLNSLRANWVGTLLAAFCLAFIPYGLISALRGKFVPAVSIDWILPRFIVVFCVLLLLRWGLVLWLG
jgi:Protein of unknown function (DUF2752)